MFFQSPKTSKATIRDYKGNMHELEVRVQSHPRSNLYANSSDDSAGASINAWSLLTGDVPEGSLQAVLTGPATDIPVPKQKNWLQAAASLWDGACSLVKDTTDSETSMYLSFQV